MHQLGDPTDARLAWPSPQRAWWTVAVLTFTYIVSFVDRTILGLLIEPIKADLSLNDTEIGLVVGLAFGVFYAVMGLPLGWLADRTSRRGLIAVGAALWCAATAACGLAASFVQLFLARFAVGVGEAALSPAAMSIISDSFPKERRAVPIGVYAAAAALGAGLAMIVGGSVIQLVSNRWQSAFVWVGLGGLVMLPLLATVTEPARRNEAAVFDAPVRIDRFIVEHADFMIRHYALVALYAIMVYAVLSWAPAMFIRVHGWTPGQTGLRYGLVLLIFGGAGTVLGGLAAAQLGKRGVQHPAIWVTFLGVAGTWPFLAMAGWADDPWTALAWYAPGLLLMTLPGGTAIQVVQEAVPNRLRGQASAIYYLSNSIVGSTLGPLSVGLLTDYIYKDPLRIGSALALLAIVIPPISALLAYQTRAPFARLVSRAAA